MTLDQLIAVEAVVAAGTFRGAADRLNKAQSAVSHQIRKLEDELQFELFSRSAYRPQLTAKGEVFYREAVRILHHTRALQTTVGRLNAEQETILRISITATMPVDAFFQILKPVSDQYPGTDIRLMSDMMGGPISRLMQGEADLIIATLDGVPVDEVEIQPVDRISIIPVCHHEFEPAKLKGVRSIAEMQAYLQVIVSDSVGGELEQSRDLMPGARRWTVSDFQTKKSAILAAMGWGGMPEHLIKDELARGDLVPLAVEGFPTRRSEVFAIRKRGHVVGPVHAALWDSLSQTQ